MADPLSPGADLAKVYGEQRRCPSCGAFAQTLPSPEFRWVCGVCGAPRVELPGETLPEEVAVALREASAAQRAAAVQRLTTWGAGIPAGFALLLAIVLAPASLIVGGVLIGMGVLLAILAARASRRAATERKRLRGAVDRSYEAAILHLAAKDKTNAEIATTLRIAEADVEATLAVSTQVRIAPPARIAESATETETGTETETESAAKAALRK